MMTIDEAIKQRHSVRAYKDMPLTDDDVRLLEDKIEELNAGGTPAYAADTERA